jgi:SNF2 family DNA or RNA helicase
MLHQKDAVEAAMAVLPADNMLALFMDIGTGKTKTAIDIAVNLAYQGHIKAMMIVCPKTLYLGWQAELSLHAGLPCRRWGLEIKSGDKAWKQIEEIKKDRFPVVIVNVEAFQQDNKYVQAIVGQMGMMDALFVLDESARCKSPDAQRTKRVIKAAQEMTGRIIMTGTEIASGIQDIYSQMEVMELGFWKRRTGIKNHFLWKHEFCVMTKGYGPDGKTFDKILKPSEMNAYQRSEYERKLSKVNAIISPYVFRAKREDCVDLPDKIHETLLVEPTHEEAKAYKDMRDQLIHILSTGEVVASENAISLYIRLRQITGGFIADQSLGPPSKLRALLDDIEDHDERAVIVAYFRKEIEAIEEGLRKDGYTVSMLHGDVRDREKAIGSFLDGKSRFLVAQHDMVAEGLNLQKDCALMYVYSRSLNANTNAQYEGRIHRIGQTRHPVYRHLVAPGTVDERVQKIIDAKISIQELFSRMKPEEIRNYL